MCWSVPGKIHEIRSNVAVVEIAGIRKEVALDLIDDAVVGEYVLIHAGYAIQRVDTEKAEYTMRFFEGKGQNGEIS